MGGAGLVLCTTVVGAVGGAGLLLCTTVVGAVGGAGLVLDTAAGGVGGAGLVLGTTGVGAFSTGAVVRLGGSLSTSNNMPCNNIPCYIAYKQSSTMYNVVIQH